MAIQDLTKKTNELLGGQFFSPQIGTPEKPFIPTAPSETPVISIDSLKPKQLVPQPEFTPTDDYSSVIQGVASQMEQPATPATDTSSALLSSIRNLMGESQGRDAYGAGQFEALGGPTLEKRKNELTAEVTRLNNEVQAQALQMEKEAGQIGASTTALNKGLSRLKRDASIRALALNSEYAMISGSLETAKSAAERAVNIRYGDIDREIDQTTKLLDLYRPFMTAEQNERADIRKTLNDEKKTQVADKKRLQQDLINLAQKQGDASTASAAIRLDPNSSTFQNDLADLQAKIAPDVERGLDIALKRAQLGKISRETSLLGEPTEKERAAERAKLLSSQGQNEVLRDKILLVDEILNSSGISTRVGPSALARKPTTITGLIAKTLFPGTTAGGLKDIKQGLTGEGQQFSGGVHKLASREFLDALIGAKQQGATFGALTDREGDALRAAATKLNDWEIKDKDGKPLGIWNIDEASFKEELNRIRELANRAIVRSGGSIISPDEQSVLDELYGDQDSSSYFNE